MSLALALKDLATARATAASFELSDTVRFELDVLKSHLEAEPVETFHPSDWRFLINRAEASMRIVREHFHPVNASVLVNLGAVQDHLVDGFVAYKATH